MQISHCLQYLHSEMPVHRLIYKSRLSLERTLGSKAFQRFDYDEFIIYPFSFSEFFELYQSIFSNATQVRRAHHKERHIRKNKRMRHILPIASYPLYLIYIAYFYYGIYWSDIRYVFAPDPLRDSRIVFEPSLKLTVISPCPVKLFQPPVVGKFTTPT